MVLKVVWYGFFALYVKKNTKFSSGQSISVPGWKLLVVFLWGIYLKIWKKCVKNQLYAFWVNGQGDWMVRDQLFPTNFPHKFRYFCVNLAFRRKCVQKTVLRNLGWLPSLMIRDQKPWYYSFPKITPRKDVFSSWYLYILLKQTLWTMENPFYMPHMWHWIPMWENFIQHK